MGLGGAEFEAVWPFEYGECRLRFYSSEEFVAGGWWLGITDRDGDLLRTEFLARTRATPGTVLAWLETFIGYEFADKLVKQARLAVESQHLGLATVTA
jgi:hypothetical protein